MNIFQNQINWYDSRTKKLNSYTDEFRKYNIESGLKKCQDGYCGVGFSKLIMAISELGKAILNGFTVKEKEKFLTKDND